MRKIKMGLQRNIQIEFLRFFFCMFVFFHHFQQKWIGVDPLIFGYGGWFGVEFFFVVSGFLLAKKAFSESERAGGISVSELGSETGCFVFRKVSSLFFVHTVAYFVALVCKIFFPWSGMKNAVRTVVASVPGYFFLHHHLGFHTISALGVEWYLSAMFVTMLVLYPLCRKAYGLFQYVIAPLIAYFSLTSIWHAGESVRNIPLWIGFAPRGLLRAFAEISLGCICFEISRHLMKRTWTKTEKMLLSIIQGGCLLFCVVFMLFYGSAYFELTAIFAVSALVILSFSEVTELHLNSKPALFFGRLSLPVYLFHGQVIRLQKAYFATNTHVLNLAVCAGVTLILSWGALRLERIWRTFRSAR